MPHAIIIIINLASTVIIMKAIHHKHLDPTVNKVLFGMHTNYIANAEAASSLGHNRPWVFYELLRLLRSLRSARTPRFTKLSFRWHDRCTHNHRETFTTSCYCACCVRPVHKTCFIHGAHFKSANVVRFS